MSTNKNRRWLKKYTKLKYLEDILCREALHLGDPSCWPDKNDRELIQFYLSKTDTKAIRSTCLTSAPDRYHFWAIFGEEALGVCLWFCSEELQKDIDGDKTLQQGKVIYKHQDSMGKITTEEIPFLKRKQYGDEQEFRVLRKFRDNSPQDTWFKFSPCSLKKIYLNSWLTGDSFQKEKSRVNELLVGRYAHVKLNQNRVLNHKPWIDAVKAAAEPTNT